MPTVIDDLLNCYFCKSSLEEPLQLPCLHIFCKECLIVNNKESKITCPKCQQIHSVNGAVDKAFKPSSLTNFWLHWNHGHFDNLKLSEDEKIETEGLCEECAPKQPVKPKTTDKNQVEPEKPTLVKLKPCFHCKKKLCENCRTKHYNQQREDTFKLIENYQLGSANLVLISENLNEARLKKIAEYEKLKEEIAQKKIELTKKLEEEEKSLLKKLEIETKDERDKIQRSNDDIKTFQATKEVTKNMREKIMVEKDKKKLSEICKEFAKAQPELKSFLTSEAQRIDPTKEKKLVYTPTKHKEDIIGTLEQKKGNLKLKQADIPDNTKTKVCVIL